MWELLNRCSFASVCLSILYCESMEQKVGPWMKLQCILVITCIFCANIISYYVVWDTSVH